LRKPRRQRAYQGGYAVKGRKGNLAPVPGSVAAEPTAALVAVAVPSKQHRYPDDVKQLGVACFIATGSAKRAAGLMADFCPQQVPHRETFVEWLAAGIRPTEEQQELANSLKDAHSNDMLEDALAAGIATAKARVESGEENLWNLNGYIKILSDALNGRKKTAKGTTIAIGSVNFGVSEGRQDKWDVEGEVVGSGSGST
jgi:hypothetical protein